MALRHGQKAETTGGREMSAAGSALGFLALAVPAVAIFAAVVIVPIWASTACAEYEAACLAAAQADLETQQSANRRVRSSLDHDPVLQKRLAESHLPLVTPNERVSAGRGRPAMPDVVRPAPHARPDPPSPVLMRVGRKLTHRPTRRGLTLLAFMTLAAGCFLFPPRRGSSAIRPTAPRR